MSMELILIVQIDPANEHNIDENFMSLLRCNYSTLLGGWSINKLVVT